MNKQNQTNEECLYGYDCKNFKCSYQHSNGCIRYKICPHGKECRIKACNLNHKCIFGYDCKNKDTNCKYHHPQKPKLKEQYVIKSKPSTNKSQIVQQKPMNILSEDISTLSIQTKKLSESSFMLYQKCCEEEIKQLSQEINISLGIKNQDQNHFITMIGQTNNVKNLQEKLDQMISYKQETIYTLNLNISLRDDLIIDVSFLLTDDEKYKFHMYIKGKQLRLLHLIQHQINQQETLYIRNRVSPKLQSLQTYQLNLTNISDDKIVQKLKQKSQEYHLSINSENGIEKGNICELVGLPEKIEVFSEIFKTIEWSTKFLIN